MTSNELKIKEIQSDIDELNLLINQASRPNNKQLLTTQLEKLRTDLARLQKSEEDRKTRLANSSTNITGYIKKIETYGWDQSEKFVKIYVTGLSDLDKLVEGDVTCNFSTRSFDLMIKNLNKINYNLVINNLLNDIDATQSYFKAKSDMVTVFLKKANVGLNWAYLLEKEAKIKDKPLPKMDENADPQEGLMSMMKKMYEEGDDEMKRTISKAFSESREKSMKGEMPGLDGMNL